jgi:hypothetical protein
VCLAGAVPGIAAAQPIPAGTEFRANDFTVNAQTLPAVGMASDGSFTVVWESNTQDGNATGVFGRRFNASGVAQASEFRVNAVTSGPQFDPAVGMAANGAFVVVFVGGSDQDGSAGGVFARRFNSSGTAQATEFQVNSFTPDGQTAPATAMTSVGDFVVAWSSYGQDGSTTGVFARRFNSAGTALGADFQVNAYATGVQSAPSVGIESDRDFVVAWRSNGQDGSENGVFARRFNSAGSALAAEFQVNVFTLNSQNYPAVAMASGGAFVVAWESQGQDGQNYGVFARRFNSAGVSQASEFLANGFTMNAQRSPAAVMNANGSFALTWQDAEQDGNNNGVFARAFDASGVAQGGEVQVNTYVTQSQNLPAVGGDGTGRFVVVWESYLQDGQMDGAFAQRFLKPLAVLDVDGNGIVDPLTDSLLVLRFTFGFTGATLTTGAVGAGCTRCNAGAIEAYLATLD